MKVNGQYRSFADVEDGRSGKEEAYLSWRPSPPAGERRKLDFDVELRFAAVLPALHLSRSKHGARQLQVPDLHIRAAGCRRHQVGLEEDGPQFRVRSVVGSLLGCRRHRCGRRGGGVGAGSLIDRHIAGRSVDPSAIVLGHPDGVDRLGYVMIVGVVRCKDGQCRRRSDAKIKGMLASHSKKIQNDGRVESRF